MADNTKRHVFNTGTLMIFIGLILIISAIGLILHNHSESKQAGEASEQAFETILERMTSETETFTYISPKKSEIEPPETSSASSKTKEIEEDQSVPVTVINNYYYMGILEIPSLGLQLPIMYEWGYDNLTVSVCRYTGSLYSNDLVICGHNYSSHFGGLSSLGPGSDIYITTLDSEVFHYVVDTIEVIEPTQVESMVNSSYDLSLFTCTLSGQARCTVRCIRD